MVTDYRKSRVKAFRSDETLEAFLRSGAVDEILSFTYSSGSPRIIFIEKVEDDLKVVAVVKKEKKLIDERI
jgi:hypothetical protein